MTITSVISLITDVGGADRRESLSESKSVELNKYYFDNRPTWRARLSVIRPRDCRLLRNHERIMRVAIGRIPRKLSEALGSNLDADATIKRERGHDNYESFRVSTGLG